MTDNDRDSAPSAGLWLALGGLVGLAATVALGLMTLLGSQSLIAVSIALYGAGYVALTVVTAGNTLRRFPLWTLRILGPLLGPVLVVGISLLWGGGG